MSRRDDDIREYYPTPWPVGSWLLPTFWLVALLLALLFWWFS